MTTELPRLEVARPAAVPYPFGLFSLPTTPPPADEHWRAGVWWRSNAGVGQVGVTNGPCNVDSTLPIDALDDGFLCTIPEGFAFTVYARSDESVGGGTLTEKFANARQTLLLGEQFAVEEHVWALMLAQATEVVSGAGAVAAIAAVEQAIVDNYSGSPVLHMNRATTTLGHLVIQRDGTRLASLLGSPVVAGGGYGAGVVLATGAMVIMRSEVFDLGQHIDRSNNSVSAVVERTYVVGWDSVAVRSNIT